MRNGSKSCPFCLSRYTFEEFELVDFRESDRPPCEGCLRFLAILRESARRKAEMKAADADAPEPVDLSSPSAILARLLANRRKPAEPEPFDARMAAAGDRE